MRIVILPLDTAHAQDAARLHMEGQPGTFLTSLGGEVLTVLYTALPQAPAGFGFAAVADDGRTVGFVSAATSTSALFLHLMTRCAGRFLPVLLRRFADQPRLLLGSFQAIAYPLLTNETNETDSGGESGAESGAELLSIMVEAEMRSRGLGAILLVALMAECRRRGVVALHVTVDAANRDAQRFYERHDFHRQAAFQLFGRMMYLYQLHLQP